MNFSLTSLAMIRSSIYELELKSDFLNWLAPFYDNERVLSMKAGT
jgi:hypothetical protein